MNDKQTAADFATLAKTLETLATASQRMSVLQAETERIYLESVGEVLEADFASLQQTISECERICETLVERNPQWFEGRSKTVKTPFGSVSKRSTTRLKVANEEATLVILEQLGQDGLPYVRTTKSVNLEALELLSDEELDRLKVERIRSESINVKPAKVDMGKAARAAAESDDKGSKPTSK